MHDHRSPDGTFSQGAAAASDRELLTRFIRRSDERAFGEIVRRHSTLVLGVCRRVLRDRHAAEDAFQATFLVLARSARSIRRQRSLASWLHSVAYRIARRALADSHRRREQAAPMETVTTSDELQDVGSKYEQQLLDEELQDLPPKYREPLVLHHLQGLSQQQVAERLGVSVSAVDGRLKRGRKQLKLRLLRRGVEFGTVLAAVGLCHATAQAASVEPLIALTTQAAAAAHAGSAAPTASSQAASLAGKELTIMAGSTKLVATLGVSAVLVALIGLTAGSAASGTESASAETIPTLSTVVDGNAPRVTAETVLAQADVAVSRSIGSGSEEETAVELPVRSPTLDYSRSDPSTERITQALETTTALEFPGNPLSDVAEYISEIHDIPILFDGQALLDNGISVDEEVSIMVTGIRLSSGLEILLRNVAGVELDYVIQNEVLTITTREQADRLLDTRVYNLRHLSPTYTSEEVARVVRSAVRPWTWREQGVALQTGMGLGPDASGEVNVQIDERFQASVEALPDALVVTQSQRIHREVVDLLQQLHHHSPESTNTTIIEAAINEQLDQPVEWEFEDVALRDALRLLSEDTGINIVLDDRSLNDAGVTGDESISIVLSGITVRSALRILLADVSSVELAWFIEDEVIKVTTMAAATSRGHALAESPSRTRAEDSLIAETTEPPADVSIRGVVRVQGSVPTLPPLVVAGDPDVRNASILEHDVPDESLIVDADNRLANVFVWLRSVPEDATSPRPPTEPLVIASRGLRYVPHAAVVRSGQPIQLKNADPVVTNVRTAPLLNAPFNQSIAARNLQGARFEFEHPERLPVRFADDFHPTRLAWVLPLDHPFADVTDESGQFSIPQLPPGDYELTIWHERVGYLERRLPVTVAAGGPAEIFLDVDAEVLLESLNTR